MRAKAGNACPDAARNRKSPFLRRSTLWASPYPIHEHLQSFRLLVLFPRSECQAQQFLQD
jgi:hypothetical protein